MEVDVTSLLLQSQTLLHNKKRYSKEEVQRNINTLEAKEFVGTDGV